MEQGGCEDFLFGHQLRRDGCELKKQGCQALCATKCFWIFTYVVGFAFKVYEALDYC